MIAHISELTFDYEQQEYLLKGEVVCPNAMADNDQLDGLPYREVYEFFPCTHCGSPATLESVDAYREHYICSSCEHDFDVN